MSSADRDKRINRDLAHGVVHALAAAVVVFIIWPRTETFATWQVWAALALLAVYVVWALWTVVVDVPRVAAWMRGRR